jgi:hypothetical protein
VGDVRLRGSVGYEIFPDRDYGAITLTAEKRISKNLEVSLGLDRTAPPNPVNTVSIGLNKLTEWSAWGVDLEYSDDDEIQARVNMAMSLGVNPVSGAPVVQAGRTATQGALMSRVFLDHNGNGAFDEGDSPLKGVRLEVDRGILRNPSDADGFVYIPSVTPNRNLVVKVDRDSLGDPFLVPTKAGVSIVAHPGGTARVDFPVVTTGEIDGTVFKVEETKVFPVSGAELQLLDVDGKVVRELRSAFDGFYLMEFVPPGVYTVRVNPEQLARLGLNADSVRRATINGDGTIVNGQDIVLRKRGTEPAPETLPEPHPDTGAFPAPDDAPPPGAPGKPAGTSTTGSSADEAPVPRAAPVKPVTPAPN